MGLPDSPPYYHSVRMTRRLIFGTTLAMSALVG